MKLIARKEIMEFHFTLLRKSDHQIEIDMYNTLYKLVKVQPEGDETAIAEQAEEWKNAAGNKMSMSAELASAIVKAVKESSQNNN